MVLHCWVLRRENRWRDLLLSIKITATPIEASHVCTRLSTALWREIHMLHKEKPVPYTGQCAEKVQLCCHFEIFACFVQGRLQHVHLMSQLWLENHLGPRLIESALCTNKKAFVFAINFNFFSPEIENSGAFECVNHHDSLSFFSTARWPKASVPKFGVSGKPCASFTTVPPVAGEGSAAQGPSELPFLWAYVGFPARWLRSTFTTKGVTPHFGSALPSTQPRLSVVNPE